MSVFSKFYRRKSGIDTFFKRGVVTKKDGLTVAKIAVATFDPSANTGERTIAAHGLGVYLPDNAIIIRAWYDVITTFTSAGADAGTIALKAEGANDLVDAIAISDGTDPWDDTAPHGCLPNNFALDGGALTALAMAVARTATTIKTTAERELVATVAGQALTAGKLVLYVEYVISD